MDVSHYNAVNPILCFFPYYALWLPEAPKSLRGRMLRFAQRIDQRSIPWGGGYPPVKMNTKYIYNKKYKYGYGKYRHFYNNKSKGSWM